MIKIIYFEWHYDRFVLSCLKVKVDKKHRIFPKSIMLQNVLLSFDKAIHIYIHIKFNVIQSSIDNHEQYRKRLTNLGK